MTSTRIESFSDLHRVICDLRSPGGWSFRGQTDASWKLLPKAGRYPFTERSDHEAFDYWKFCAVEHYPSPPESEWEWLAVAQHHGLATRLLDWSYNPLVAAFFAVRESRDTDALLAAVRFREQANIGVDDPMEFSGVGRFTSRRVVSRIARQSGTFTIHGPPTVGVDADEVECELQSFLIAKEYRQELLRELEHLYVHEAALFPDLDGLSSYVNWKWGTQKYWHKERGATGDA